MPDAGSRDVHLVRFAVLHDFGIASRYDDARGIRGSSHGADLSFQNVRRQPCFEHITHNQGLSPCSGDGEVVHCSVYGELSDGASRKAQRLHNETIGGKRNTSAVDVYMRRIP